jgi:NAD(P)-dependent dehydrogenase (short-subunit alcohol dehydrogenase family)
VTLVFSVQLCVHPEDTTVVVGAIPPAVESKVPDSSSTLALAHAGHQRQIQLPRGVYDVNGQQLDTRRENSWLLKLGEVATVEAAEVLAINTLAPFTLASRLRLALIAAVEASKAAAGAPDTLAAAWIVNVSAMEGKFYRYKTPNHPHTNMAKAALNMMTRTSADDLHRHGVYMNSVDTGWINDENPLEKASRLAQPGEAHREGFQTPIDEVDAAARILDPVFVGINEGTLHYGVFFKDFELTEW